MFFLSCGGEYRYLDERSRGLVVLFCVNPISILEKGKLGNQRGDLVLPQPVWCLCECLCAYLIAIPPAAFIDFLGLALGTDWHVFVRAAHDGGQNRVAE